MRIFVCASRRSVDILLCNIIFTLTCQLSRAFCDSNKAWGQSEYSEHQSQVGHSNTSAAELLHPDVRGTTAGVFNCLPELNKEKTISSVLCLSAH